MGKKRQESCSRCGARDRSESQKGQRPRERFDSRPKEKKAERQGIEEQGQINAQAEPRGDLRTHCPSFFTEVVFLQKTLLEMFPEDTEKRYTSRCYHKVKDFEIQAGKSDGDAKALAQAMHKHAKEMWFSMFAAGSLST